MRLHFITISFLLFCLSCAPAKWILVESSSVAIPVDSTADALADQQMNAFIAPIREELHKNMDKVIGQASETMKVGKPESLLSNWSADVYLKAADAFLKKPVDMAVVNIGSLRTSIPKGDITIGTVFQLMPFENELVILWLKGSEVIKLLEIFAREGGQGVAGVRMDILHGKVKECSIQGKPIDSEKLYSIATNDFLAGGNDRMIPLATPVERVNCGIRIRDVFMEFIIQETKAGNFIHSELDGRIRVLNE